ncbi:MAG: endonuclease/exonuclease/phosphatase family protein [Actinobacteria bacterium]|nr:endonuclease/exonuclease/phosphatase family protein [Actinomycetota bacterium]
MRLVTWNVAGRVARHRDQARVVAEVDADIVALQEVTARTLPLWRVALAGMGYCGCETALGVGRVATGRRALGVLTAARESLVVRSAGVPFLERVLCCAVGDVEVVNVHSPIASAPELAKVRTHEAVAAYLAGGSPPGPRILCGDLNTPRRELADGEVLTFACDSAGRLRPERGERWDRAERALVYGLRELGWVDAFRALHGYGERQASWTFPEDRGGWRLDHVLVDRLRPVASAYAHDWRRAGLSDHSALVVDFAA